jgi:hypothetical protein
MTRKGWDTIGAGKKEELIPVEDYARETRTSVESVVSEIRMGRLAGRVITDTSGRIVTETWYVDPTHSATTNESFGKRLLILPLILFLLFVANFLTMGMPGYALFTLGDAIARAIFGTNALGYIHGDNLLPISMMMGFAWPIGAFVAWAGLFAHKAGRPWSMVKVLFFLLALLAWDVGLSVYYHLGVPW